MTGLAEALGHDLRVLLGREPGRVDTLRSFIVEPGFRAVALYRVQAAAWGRSRMLARLVSGLNHILTGAEFVPGCVIGPGLLVRHPTGLVVGAGAVVGTGCTLFQGTTLGRRSLEGPGHDQYPVVGDGVLIGAGATVLGPVRLGAGSVVGAMTLVIADVPPGVTVVGVPARVTSRVTRG